MKAVKRTPVSGGPSFWKTVRSFVLFWSTRTGRWVTVLSVVFNNLFRSWRWIFSHSLFYGLFKEFRDLLQDCSRRCQSCCPQVSAQVPGNWRCGCAWTQRGSGSPCCRSTLSVWFGKPPHWHLHFPSWWSNSTQRAGQTIFWRPVLGRRGTTGQRTSPPRSTSWGKPEETRVQARRTCPGLSYATLIWGQRQVLQAALSAQDCFNLSMFFSPLTAKCWTPCTTSTAASRWATTCSRVARTATVSQVMLAVLFNADVPNIIHVSGCPEPVPLAGSAVVDWLVFTQLALSRVEAMTLASALLEEGFLRTIGLKSAEALRTAGLGEQLMDDSTALYSFVSATGKLGGSSSGGLNSS